MDTIEAILSRRSVRKFTEQEIAQEVLDTILRAAVSGPSCANTKDWDFFVVKDKETLSRMADGNGPYAAPLKGCAVGILICGNLNRAFGPAKEYWVIDGAIAGQNLVLAAWAYGIGSVWLGTYPQMERVESQRKILSLPKHLVAHSIIALGYPDVSEKIYGTGPVPDCIHYV